MEYSKLIDGLNKRDYDLVKKNYYNILNEIINTLEKMGIKDMDEAFMTFVYMLYNGYISINNTYLYTKDPSVHNYPMSMMGFGIILGKGNCLNNAILLKDLSGINSKRSYVLLVNSKLHLQKNSGVVLKCDNYKSNVKYNSPINHAIVLVNGINNKLHIYDPTNNAICDYYLSGIKPISGAFGTMDYNYKVTSIINKIDMLTNLRLRIGDISKIDVLKLKKKLLLTLNKCLKSNDIFEEYNNNVKTSMEIIKEFVKKYDLN